jgi:hypothetical protein
MEEGIYIITILCVDDENLYIDYINKRFKSLDLAKEEMAKSAFIEFNELRQINDCYNIVNGDDITIYHNMKILTRYSIIKI